MKTKQPHEQTYYELLDIDVNASELEVNEAYRRACTIYSSDNPALYHLFNKDEAADLQQLLDEAYSVLSDSSRRKLYDSNRKSLLSEGTNMELQNVTFETNTEISKVAPGHPKYGRTRYGQYLIDDQFEEVIRATEEFNGPLLKKVRLYKNLNPDQVADATKINRAYLNALESHDFSGLPAWVYIRGFVTQLAKVLGLDINKVVASYAKIYKAYEGEEAKR